MTWLFDPQYFLFVPSMSFPSFDVDYDGVLGSPSSSTGVPSFSSIGAPSFCSTDVSWFASYF